MKEAPPGGAPEFITLCLIGIIVMMLLALFARYHARGFSYLISNHYCNPTGRLTFPILQMRELKHRIIKSRGLESWK